MKAKGMSTAGQTVAAAPSKQDQNAAGQAGNKKGFMYAKLIRNTEDELKAAIENNWGPQEVFKLKQKLAMYKKMMSKISEEMDDGGEESDLEDKAAEAAAGSALDGIMSAMSEDVDSEDLIEKIVEKLTVDMGADLAGWAGRSQEDKKYQMEKEMAHRRSTDVEEEMKDLKKAQEEVVFENKQLTDKLSEYEAAISELKEGLQDTNLSNARLLYTNRVLRNTSLNERQKDKIAEAISNAGSVTEAKTIYDTLQSTVEAKPKRSPQSLSEAIGRRNTVLRATRQEAPACDPFQDRMKKLAGIQ
jgi:hypothetical protein